MAPHWLEVTLSSVHYNPEVSQGHKKTWVWQPLFRFQLRPGINSAVLLLCKHILPSAAVNTERCLLLGEVPPACYGVACQDPVPSLF